jgi:sec-independent protein translocase protein TatB
MFDLSSGKLILIGVIALVVIGPKELPGVLRQVGRAVAKLRTMAGEFRQQFDEAMREAELGDVAKLVDDARGGLSSTVKGILDPVTSLPDEVSKAAAIGEIGSGTGAEAGAVSSASGGVSLDLPMPPEPPPIILPGAGSDAPPAKPEPEKSEPAKGSRAKGSRGKGKVAAPVAQDSAAPAASEAANAAAPEPKPAKPAGSKKTAAKPGPAKPSPAKAGTAKAAGAKATTTQTASAKPAAKAKSPRRPKAAVSEEGA